VLVALQGDGQTQDVTLLGVRPGATLEVTVGQFWLSQGKSALRLRLEFTGVTTFPAGTVAIDGAGAAAPVEVAAPLSRATVEPKAKLTKLRIPVRPSSHAFDTYDRDARDDMMPADRRPHSLTLTYKYKAAEGGNHTVTLPHTNGLVYDGVFESCMAMVFELPGGRRVLTTDVYPETVELKKGIEYEIRARLRHDDVSILDRHKDMSVVLERKLDKPVELPCWPTALAAIRAGGLPADKVEGDNRPVKSLVLGLGQRERFFVGTVPHDRLPKDATVGRSLIGELSLGSNAQHPLGSLDLVYAAPPPPEKPKDVAKAVAKGNEDSNKSKRDELAEALLKARVDFITGLDPIDPATGSIRDELTDELLAEVPDHLPLLLAQVDAAAKRLEKNGGVVGKDQSRAEDAGPMAKAEDADKGAPEDVPIQTPTASRVDLLRALDEAAAAVVGAIDVTAVTVWAAAKCREDKERTSPEGEANDTAKDALIKALGHRAEAAVGLAEEARDGDAGSAAREAADIAMAALRTWTDTAKDSAHAALHARWLIVKGRPAGAIACLDRRIKEEEGPSPGDIFELRARAFDALGWGIWASFARRELRARHPPGAKPLF